MNAESFLKRGTPSLWPHEIKVIEDPAHALYDERLDLPVSDSAIRNFAVRGQVQPVAVRVDGKDLVLVEGRQRWKRAVVINHVAGVHPYKGKNAAVLDAIKRVTGTELADVVSERCGNGIKLRFDVFRGTEQAAAGAAISANEHREDDPVEAKIRKAQRLAGNGFSPDDILTEFAGKVSLATVKRWLAVDLSKPKTKKVRSRVVRPGAKKLEAARAHLLVAGHDQLASVVAWTLGLTKAADVPELAGAKL